MTVKGTRKLSFATLTIPAVLIYTSVIIFPIIFNIGLSFTKWSGLGTPQWVWFDQYRRILGDPVFWHGLRNNLLIVAVSVFGQIPLGFILAYIIYRRMVTAGRFFEVMIFLPITIAPVVVAILWNQIFSPAGIVTELVRIIRNDPRYVFKIFENKQLAILPILFVIIWMYTGLYMVIYIANLQKINPELLESATIDGASEGQILVRVIIPLMVHIIFTTTIFAVTGSLKSFDLIWAFTQGGPAHYTEVIAIYMYLNTFRYYNYGLGGAISMVIILLSIIIILLTLFVYKHFEKKYE
ncbi:MAG: sugar ABC transporter permease [Spirochaetes bacterium]|nr:MAG: sugar ABC transporter permease [Spirochaetota bacterium]